MIMIIHLLFCVHILLPNQLVSENCVQNIRIHDQAGQGQEQVGEEGEEEEEGLEDIQEPSVMVAQAGREDGQEVSGK